MRQLCWQVTLQLWHSSFQNISHHCTNTASFWCTFQHVWNLSKFLWWGINTTPESPPFLYFSSYNAGNWIANTGSTTELPSQTMSHLGDGLSATLTPCLQNKWQGNWTRELVSVKPRVIMTHRWLTTHTEHSVHVQGPVWAPHHKANNMWKASFN